mmetsp:Transcript_37393/g.96669  ORF Transcript_37393/g.96669 Transcript_37393/m.96669 type:complete len:294 (+) Transcript_37393:79-960(+)
MRLVPGARDLDRHDVVGGVARGRQDALPCRHLVAWALVVLEVAVLRRLAWHEVEQRHSDVEHLGVRLLDVPRVPVPLAGLEEDAVRVHAIFGFHRRLLIFRVEEVEAQCVDGDLVLPCEVLRRTRGERLLEVDATEPESRRRAVVDPILEELQPLDEVVDVAAERLQRRVGALHPHGRCLAVEDLEEGSLELGAHEQQPLDGLLHVLQGAPDDVDEAVETANLLGQDRVHALLVECGVLLLHLRHVPSCGHAVHDVLGNLADHLVRPCTAAGAALANRHQQLGHHQVGLAHLL